MKSGRTSVALAVSLLTLVPSTASAARPGDEPVFGIRVRMGARFDDLRMCVATAAGTRGGPAMDVSLFAEVPVGGGAAVDFNLPVARPVLFALGFGMLQFEPQATLLLRDELTSSLGIVGGPSLGLSLHYGPDYRSEPSGPGRTESFFAWGPMIGAHLGLEMKRESGFDLGVGLSPYALPLFAGPRSGKVFGASLDGSLLVGR